MAVETSPLLRIRNVAWSRQQLMLDDLARLVNIDSPTRDRPASNQAADLLEEWSSARGLEVERDTQADFGDNVVARWRPPEDGRRHARIVLVGHYDTVFEAGVALERPFSIVGDHALGPGVFDMKGGIVIGLHAFDAIREVFPEIGLEITFIFNSDEEDGSWGSRELIGREANGADLVLILEPSDGTSGGPEILVGRKGGGSFRLVVAGRESHAGAAPEQGRNSIIEMAHKTVAIEELANPGKGTTLCPGVIHGGRKSYVVPAECALDFDIRVPSEEERVRVEQGLQELVRSTHVEGTTAVLTGQFHRPPWVPSEASLTYATLLQEVSATFGYAQVKSTSGSASDGNNTAASGVPTLDGFGPTGGRHHSPDEFVEIPSLTAKAAALAGFLAVIDQRGLLEALTSTLPSEARREGV
jgi:glutamate carboxypeptidase